MPPVFIKATSAVETWRRRSVSASASGLSPMRSTCLAEHLPSERCDRLPLLGDELNNGIVVMEGRALIHHGLGRRIDRAVVPGRVGALVEKRLDPRVRLRLGAINPAELWIVNQINSPIGFAICARLNDRHTGKGEIIGEVCVP